MLRKGRLPVGQVYCKPSSEAPGKGSPYIALDPHTLPVTVSCVSAKIASGECSDNSAFTIIIAHVQE